MKMKFRGWRREVYTHTHEVEAWKKVGNSYNRIDGRKSLTWSDKLTAFGKIKGLSLSGDFLVEFSFTEAELKDWIRNYFKSDPVAACALVAELQLDSIKALAKSAEKVTRA